MDDLQKFDFEKVVDNKYKIKVTKSTLKEIYNIVNNRGCATDATKKSGVYALYFNGKLKKIGRAVTGKGIFTRMSQYYRQNCGIYEITDDNKDEISVQYFTMSSRKDCWAAEKYLQAEAYYLNEDMEWDKEIKEINKIK